MKVWQVNSNSVCCVEIAYDWLKARYQDRTLELHLDRRQDFTLEANSRKAAAHELEKFLRRTMFQPRPHVFCAIPARGVSLRRLNIPVTNDEDRQKVLQLQVESEFPLSPDELAWGYIRLNGGSGPGLGAGQEQVLVAAVRKQTLRDYAELFESCDITPVFIPAGIARALACPHTPGAFAHLDLGRRYSELVTVQDGMPISMRVFLSPTRAQPQLAEPALRDGEPVVAVVPVAEDPALGRTAAGFLGLPLDLQGFRKLFVGPVRDGEWDVQALKANLTGSTEVLDPATVAGATLAIAGIEKAIQQQLPLPHLTTASAAKGSLNSARSPIPVKWATAAVTLVLLAVLFPYFAAAIHKPFLARKLAALKVDRGRLALIDSELDFLKYLKQNQAPYLDALYLISKSAPAGTRFDSLSLTRRGELAFKGTFRDPNQIADFRSKLLDTGFFSGIAVEEQTPSPDRQKFTVRMTATWRSDQMREAASLAASKEPEKPKSSLMGGAMGPMMTSPDFPSGPPPGGIIVVPGGITVQPGMPASPGGLIEMAPGMIPPGAVPPGMTPGATPAGVGTANGPRSPTGISPSPGGVMPAPIPTP